MTTCLMLGCAAHADEEAFPANHQERLKVLQATVKADYQRELTWYDDRLKDQPLDVIAAIERCRFMDSFSGMFEYEDWLDDLYEAQSDCESQLESRFNGHPEIKLYSLENAYGEQGQQHAGELLSAVDESWTRGQVARLYERLALLHQTNDPVKAKFYALEALKRDMGADVRLIAAKQLIVEGDREAASKILLSPIESHDAKDPWYASQRMGLLVQLGELPEARRVYNELKSRGVEYDRVAASKLLRQMNAIDDARRELTANQNSQWTARALSWERFVFELGYGTPEQALGAYDAFRDQGYEMDPFSINRVALLARSASLPWRPRDVLGVWAGMLLIVGVGLLTLVPISFVHYRGLSRRLAGNAPVSEPDGWNLRHAWMALSSLGAAEIMALYFGGPVDLSSISETWSAISFEPEALARMALWGEILLLGFAVCLAVAAGQRSKMSWSSQWAVIQAVAIGASIGLALRVPLLLIWLAQSQEVLAQRLLGDPALGVIKSIAELYGVTSAVWLLCIAAPVVEEFIFRGVLLQSFARHLSFGWANAIQAVLFALVHFNPAGAPLLFALAFTCGVITRRAGGLLPAIALHATFNLIAAMILLA